MISYYRYAIIAIKKFLLLLVFGETKCFVDYGCYHVKHFGLIFCFTDFDDRFILISDFSRYIRNVVQSDTKNRARRLRSRIGMLYRSAAANRSFSSFV